MVFGLMKILLKSLTYCALVNASDFTKRMCSVCANGIGYATYLRTLRAQKH